ncbi:MAG: RNA polymerase sigma-54 factor, partial [Chloroflexota bacterium]|nr:RNA polymerase sigma-54 factor [Chloroflexota bacterium]
MEHGFDFGQEMRAWVSPSLIEANYILSLSRMELENVIAAEMEANPALEADERSSCPLCGGVLDGTFCTTCLVSQAPPTENESYEDFPETMLTERREDGDDFDPMTLIAHAMSLPEQILADARTVLEPHEYHIAEFLVDAIDDRGFLTVSLEEAAEVLGTEVSVVEAVLEVIQDVAPIGVGARDLQECLLLQLRHLDHSGEDVPPRVNEIVTDHLAAFGAHKFGQIARALDVSTDEIEATRDFIRNHLNPFPLQAQQARWWRSPSDAVYVAPDVLITIKDEALQVEVVDAKHFHLRMNPLYSRLATEMGGRRPPRAKAARAAAA